ncbi:energy-coupling factor transporter transmembrane component T [Paenibacillus sp. GCM10023248]|uniref:energy-coupling factor transporter transmembrane component T n=1 Tax=Bacillales TaxID=1385 RepID=UPI002378FBBF|nr:MULTISPECIES: energy-coupling factor transporter transmembrane component T [Bacillales]MDD9271197.1 energy-coupling factor transporter transmembrane component T [Paenibacillus sp. MAHUQ-63]MDR6881685.1 energy-coupling factor transport system permease protein [Bacillus sp. 3255]
MKDAFSSYHPLVNFLYFAMVLACSMFFLHPACLLISLFLSLAYAIYLNGRRAIRFHLLVMLPMLIVTALMNPAFNHEGVTILTYLDNGNPLTLESIAYGAASAAMLITVISWFSCYNAVMTSDKFIYLFGKLLPAMSLIFSMVLRFVPSFKAQFQRVSDAQKCIGRDMSNGGVIARIRHGVRILSIMTTWMLENAIETSDSMRSRGYGLKGRTAYSNYTFDRRDRRALCALGVCGGYCILNAMRGTLYFRYFPSMKGHDMSLLTVSTLFSYALMCAIPLIMNLWEDRKWKLLMQSKI